MGLPRDAPAITVDFEELKSRLQSLEQKPAWCSQVPSLDQTFSLSDAEGIFLEDKSHERASPKFLEKSMLAGHSISVLSELPLSLKL